MKFLRPGFVALLLVGFVNGKAQQVAYLEKPVTIHINNVAVAEVFKTISAQTGVVFSYTQPFNDGQMVTLNCEKASLGKVLNDLLTPLNCSYVLKDKYIIIKNEKPVAPQPNVITGYIYNVYDSTSIAEASVYMKQTKHSTVSNKEGHFTLSYASKIPEISVSFAKEDYRDTSAVVYNKTKQELYVYLFPKTLPSDTATLVASSVVGNGSLAVHSDSLAAQSVVVESNFWTRFKASHPNIRNITDTLFNHVSISLVPSVSTNKDLSINTVNEYSLNILVGQSKGVTKCEVGYLLNIDNGNVQWAQVASGGNIVSGNVKGGQSAGIFNSVSGNVLGGQVAGIINIDRGNLKGGEAAGIININKGDILGGQAAGIINIDKGELKGGSAAGLYNKGHYVNGGQVAGICNVVDSIRGFQVAGITNISRYTSGFQVAGILNKANYLKGAQLALFNVADSCEGIPIGLISFVRHGYHKLEITTDEMGFATVGFRTGVKRFHNILFVGGNYTQKDIWCYGYGIGSAIQLSKSTDLSLSITAQQMQKTNISELNMNLLCKFYVGFDYNISKHFGLSIGPSFNLQLSDITDVDYASTYDKLAPYTILNETNNNTKVKMWIGGQLAVRIF